MCKKIDEATLRKFSKTASIDNATLCTAEFRCIKKVPPAPTHLIGTCDYYLWRYANFLERHISCGHTPPDYYICYGLKYCLKFSGELRPTLSDRGKQWLDTARSYLQVYLESGVPVTGDRPIPGSLTAKLSRYNGAGLVANPEMELDHNSFRSFAFAVHEPAYWDANIHGLPWISWDRWMILKTPGNDLISIDSLTQISQAVRHELFELIFPSAY